MNKAVFTTDRGEFHQQAALEAAPAGLEVRMLRAPAKAELIQALDGAAFLISERTGVIDREIIDSAPDLKLIQRLGSLTFDIDLDAAKTAGVAVCSWPIDGVIRVAEHIMLQMLALAKRLREVEAIARLAGTEWGESKRTDEDTFAYNWSQRRGIGQLWGKSIGIVGMGEIGVELARRLHGWGCQVLYHKRTRLPAAVEAEFNLVFCTPDELYRESAFLVNLLPYSSATDHLLDAEVFVKMKQGAFLVSCGSGSTIDEAALAEALRAGRLAGAALDTFEWEPIRADDPLTILARENLNVLLTPHTAAGTGPADSTIPSRAQDYTNIRNYLAGRPLLYQVA